MQAFIDLRSKILKNFASWFAKLSATILSIANNKTLIWFIIK